MLLFSISGNKNFLGAAEVSGVPRYEEFPKGGGTIFHPTSDRSAPVPLSVQIERGDTGLYHFSNFRCFTKNTQLKNVLVVSKTFQAITYVKQRFLR